MSIKIPDIDFNEVAKKIDSSPISAELIASILWTLLEKKLVSPAYFLNRYNLNFPDLMAFGELTGTIIFIPGEPIMHRAHALFPTAHFELTSSGFQLVNYLRGIK